MPRIKRVFRRLTDDERARAAKVREEIKQELPEIMADSRRIFAHKERVQGIFSQLRGMREGMGLSLNDLAARTGIHKSNLSRLEAGTMLNPTLDTLMRYASALGKSIYVNIADDPPRKKSPAATRGKKLAGRRKRKISL